MACLNEVVRAAVAGLACVGVAAGCSATVGGVPRAQSARDGGAAAVAAGQLEPLLLSDAQIGEIVGTSGMATSRGYSVIPAPQGESYSEPACAQTLYNTMYTGYENTGYTGVAGRKVRKRGDRSFGEVDQGVVAFPSADAASRFVVRTVLGWERCADVHLGVTDPRPDPVTVYFTLGFTSSRDDVATVVNTLEGGEGLVCARGITSRSNVVIDVYVCAKSITGAQPAAVINAIANTVPR